MPTKYFPLQHMLSILLFIAAMHQLYIVRLSVIFFFLTGLTMFLIISSWNFPEWLPLTRVMSMLKFGINVAGQNPVYPFSDRNSRLNSHTATKWCIKLHVAKERCPIVFQCDLSNFKSHGTTKIRRFRTVNLVWIRTWLQNEAQNQVIHQISRSHGTKNRQFWPKWVFRNVTPVWILE